MRIYLFINSKQYLLIFLVNRNAIYSGAYGYDVAFRIEGDKIYSGGYVYEIAYRVGR